MLTWYGVIWWGYKKFGLDVIFGGWRQPPSRNVESSRILCAFTAWGTHPHSTPAWCLIRSCTTYIVHCMCTETTHICTQHTLSYKNIFYKCINVPIVHTLPTPKRRPAKMTGIEDHWMYDGSPLNFCASGSAMHRHYLQLINYCLTVLTVCWKYEWTFTKLCKRRITRTQLYRMYTVCKCREKYMCAVYDRDR